MEKRRAGRTNEQEGQRLQLEFALVPWSFASLGLA